MAGGGGGGNTAPGPAAEALAGISREQFGDWQKRYRPFGKALAAEVNNPLTIARRLDTTSRTIGTQFDVQKANTERNMSRLGVTMTPQQKASLDRQSAISQAGVNAAARNSVRGALRERDSQIIGEL